MARLVEAKAHVHELESWMKVQYIICTVTSCVTVTIVAMLVMGAPISYFALFTVCICLALWLKYFMLMYHRSYHNTQLKRAQHALHTLNNHHYTEQQHADVIKKSA